MARLVLLLFLTFAAAPPVCAQAPVPDGQAASTATLSGTVQVSGGEVLAKVTVKSEENSREISITTNPEGEFKVSLRPGRYTVTADAEGFAPAIQKVSVVANQAMKIQLTLNKPGPVPQGETSAPNADQSNCGSAGNLKGGQVCITTVHPGAGGASIPDGEYRGNVATANHVTLAHEGTTANSTPPGDVPIPAAGAVAVSGVFSTSVALAGWLNGQSARNLRLQAIVSPAQGNQNLFVWIVHTGADQHFVVSANQMSSSKDLQNILKAYPQAAVVGLAWVEHDRFLVLRSNP